MLYLLHENLKKKLGLIGSDIVKNLRLTCKGLGSVGQSQCEGIKGEEEEVLISVSQYLERVGLRIMEIY